MKTNELQTIPSVLGTDTILVDTDAKGTGRVPFDAAVQFFKDTFLAGGVPYGKELTESWAALQARVKAGNFKGIHIGDYKTITLTTGEVVVMEVAGIDQYYKCGDQEIGHHIDLISRDCLANNPAGKFKYNDTNINNGTAAEPNPFRASKLFKTLNDEASGVYATLPADLKPCIIEKRALLEKRYSDAGEVNADTGYIWANMGKLWLPLEVEVFGHAPWSDVGYGTWGGGCNKQYPIFIGNSLHLIKGNGNGGAHYTWWEASALRGSATYFCYVGSAGHAHYYAATYTGISVPLCFRIG